MRKIEKSKKQAIELINNSNEFVVLTEEGMKTHSSNVTLLSLITNYLHTQLENGNITEEEIDKICKYSKLDEKELVKEMNKELKKNLKDILKSNEEFMDFIKDLIGE